MNLQERIKALSFLGRRLEQLTDERKEWAREAYIRNRWFTEENTALAFQGIIKFLKQDVLEAWTADYDFGNSRQAKIVGVVMAGNIPMAGFHDLLSVLISGHKIMAKLSSQDPVLIKHVTDLLIEIEPWFGDRILFRDKIAEADAYIATGSNNTSRYFQYYFSRKPHIIRKNRSSVALIKGEEDQQALEALGKDIFTYFGLGCRSVSKIYFPQGYLVERVLPALSNFSSAVDFQKYANNYEYNRAVYLLKKIPYIDTGYIILREDESVFSPVAVLHFSFYQSEEDLDRRLKAVQDQIQITTSAGGWYRGSVPFGKAQQPEVWEYADKVDTLRFLSEL